MENFNPWWVNQRDYIYEIWQKRSIRWIPAIIDSISLTSFALHFVTGPRQVGKTTALKIFIHHLLDDGYPPMSIFYYQCDELLDFRELGQILDSYHASRKLHKIEKAIIILDEIPYVKEWWRAIKARIDKGQFQNDILIITGSASIELLKEKERFPGRRGNGQDYLFFPLNFEEYFKVWSQIKQIKIKIPPKDLEEMLQTQNGEFKSPKEFIQPYLIYNNSIDQAFRDYLITGGFPLSILDFFSEEQITLPTKQVYLDWIRGDIRRMRLNEAYMKEILAYLLQTRTSPISWNSIAQNTSINSPHTIQTYVNALKQMYVLEIFYHISSEGKILYRKNKKIHFIDPFLIQVLVEYTHTSVLPEHIVEAVVATHFNRRFPTYYYHHKSEVDVVSIINNELVGFEVKWGPKNWKRPLYLKKCYVLTKNVIPSFLAILSW